MRQFRSVKPSGMWHERNAQKTLIVVNLGAAKPCRVKQKVRQVERRTAIISRVVRNNGEIGSDAFPHSGYFRHSTQLLVIDESGVRDGSDINDVAKPNIEMPIHALERGDDETIGNGWHGE